MVVENVSLLDMYPTDDLDENEAEFHKKLFPSKNDKDNLKIDPKRIKVCKECGKEFELPLGVRAEQYSYQETQKGRKCWFCSWTCLSRNRKARGK